MFWTDFAPIGQICIQSYCVKLGVRSLPTLTAFRNAIYFSIWPRPSRPKFLALQEYRSYFLHNFLRTIDNIDFLAREARIFRLWHLYQKSEYAIRFVDVENLQILIFMEIYRFSGFGHNLIGKTLTDRKIENSQIQTFSFGQPYFLYLYILQAKFEQNPPTSCPHWYEIV